MFVVMLPWGQQKQLTAGTGLHAFPAWLGKVGEAVFQEDDERQSFVEGGMHDGFLARRDGG